MAEGEFASGSGGEVGQSFDFGDGQRDEAGVLGWVVVPPVGSGAMVFVVSIDPS